MPLDLGALGDRAIDLNHLKQELRKAFIYDARSGKFPVVASTPVVVA